MGIKNHIRNSLLYRPWRFYREHQRVARFETLLDSMHAPGRVLYLYDEKSIRDRFAALAAERRRITANRKPGVAAFGTREWEDKGLWQSFSRNSDFSLYDYVLSGGLSSHGRHNPDKKLQQLLGVEFLSHIRERDSDGRPVDIAFFYASGAYIDTKMICELKRLGIWTVLLGLDDKQQLPGPPIGNLKDWQLDASRSVDIYWTTWRTGVKWLASHGANPWYSPPAADPEYFRPLGLSRDIDVLWIGSAYGRRMEFIRYLRHRGFNVMAYGPGWKDGFVPFEDAVRLINRAKVVLGMGGVGHTEQFKHLKGRDFEIPMCGAVYLTSYNPEITDHFVVGEEILCFSSYVECADLLHFILRRPHDMERIRDAARNRSMRDHTWEKRINELLRFFPGDVPKQ